MFSDICSGSLQATATLPEEGKFSYQNVKSIYFIVRRRNKKVVFASVRTSKISVGMIIIIIVVIVPGGKQSQILLRRL